MSKIYFPKKPIALDHEENFIVAGKVSTVLIMEPPCVEVLSTEGKWFIMSGEMEHDLIKFIEEVEQLHKKEMD